MEKLCHAPALLMVAEIELVYRPKIKASARMKVTTSSDAERILRSTWNPNSMELREEFKIMLLNRKHCVLGIVTISTGGIHGTIVDIRHVFASALKANATALILAHNHPSGGISPSTADRIVTEQIKIAGEMLQIHLNDHIILTDEAYYSFADEGVL